MTRGLTCALLCCLAALLPWVACGCAPVDRDTSRVSSPDGRVDAVLVCYGNGDTTAESARVFVVPAHGRTDSASTLLCDKYEGSKLSWSAPRRLVFSYKKARIFEFSNFWQSRDVDNFNYLVEIRLAPPSASSSP